MWILKKLMPKLFKHQREKEDGKGDGMKNLKLKAARAGRDLSQEELANLVGVTGQSGGRQADHRHD